MSTFDRIDQAAHEGAFGQNRLTEPSPAQQDAGNYKKGRVSVQGMRLVIENPRASLRGWRAEDGSSGTNLMKFHYGYFEGVRGADGDELDVFVGPWPEHRTAFVVNQHVRGTFDEHKVMLGFPDQRTAEAAYLSNYDRGWSGLGSCVACSIAQLKWWLLHGEKSQPLTRDQLPFEERNDMDKVIWDSAHQPRDCTAAQLLYEIRKHDGQDGLIFDPLTVADIEEDAEGVLALDALVVPYLKLEQRMSILRKALARAGGTLDVAAFQTTKPFTQRGSTNVAVVFELSDGQTLSIFFHNPDVTPKKILPGDDLVSWKWMLNKKDVTIAVAPERGVDLNVRTVALRIMTLANKNSARFVAANARRAERLQNIDQLKATIEDRQRELAGIEQEISELTVSMESRYASAIRETNDTQAAYGRAKENGGTDPQTGRTVDELAAETDVQVAAIRTLSGLLNDDGTINASEPEALVEPLAAAVVEPIAEHVADPVAALVEPVIEPAAAAPTEPEAPPEPIDPPQTEPEAEPEPSAAAPIDPAEPVAASSAPVAAATPDVSYRAVDDMFTAFYPNTPIGEDAWKRIAEHTDGTGKVLHAQVDGTVQQLREAGYTVEEETPEAPTDAQSVDALAAALAEPPVANDELAARVHSAASEDPPKHDALAALEPVAPIGDDPDMAYLESIIAGTLDLSDEGIPTALRDLHERRKDDAAVLALFGQAADAYKTYAIERARAVLEAA